MEQLRKKYPVPMLEHELFSTKTDEPLRYFSVKEVFVRHSGINNHKLYCDGRMVLLLMNDNYLITTPRFRVHHTDFVEAFVHDYCPTVSTDDLQNALGKFKALYTHEKQLIAK